MQKQYKIYKIDKNANDSTLLELSKYDYVKINDYAVAIQYDYLLHGYKKLLESMSELQVSQYIVTASVFYKLISNLVENGLEIYEIKLNILFEEDNTRLQRYITKINQKSDTKNSLEGLLEILKWYNYDEDIDISHVTFGIKDDNRNFRVYFYNNGIVAIDSEKIIHSLINLLKNLI